MLACYMLPCFGNYTHLVLFARHPGGNSPIDRFTRPCHSCVAGPGPPKFLFDDLPEPATSGAGGGPDLISANPAFAAVLKVGGKP